MNWLKGYLQDFPTTAAAGAVAILLVLLTGLVVCGRLAFGKVLPAGYDTWFLTLVTLTGVAGASMVGKRLSDIAYKAAGTSPVNVGGPSTVNVSAQPAVVPDPNAADKL